MNDDSGSNSGDSGDGGGLSSLESVSSTEIAPVVSVIAPAAPAPATTARSLSSYFDQGLSTLGAMVGLANPSPIGKLTSLSYLGKTYGSEMSFANFGMSTYDNTNAGQVFEKSSAAINLGGKSNANNYFSISPVNVGANVFGGSNNASNRSGVPAVSPTQNIAQRANSSTASNTGTSKESTLTTLASALTVAAIIFQFSNGH